MKYIPEDIFHAIINKKLNQMRQWPALLDKNLLGILFKKFNQPEIVLKNMNGFFYVDNKIVTEEIAVETVLNQKCPMIIKPSIDSGNGQNVIVFWIKNGLTSIDNLSVIEIFRKYRKDFIIQFLVDQHEALKSLNPTSLNTLRILTYLNNDGVHILSSVIRIGKKGNFTDNVASGGIGCGIQSNGRLKEFGHFESGVLTTKTDTNVILKDFKVPGYNMALEHVKKMHLLIPYFKLISWDIGIDNKNEPILIEYNTYHQGIYGHQLANGPLFGSFTDEILSQK
ncbi:sugar-transfer associated ATP-grasp domain-containing protein [Gaetbulibacter aestuarii]|uniref:Sugar-transfer associated ATP-grasp domain-containing protein n=1 Tax=Gaetbulibacter aestuarii TaxID=1502358 RepID=A0ABW7N246_9FLAO